MNGQEILSKIGEITLKILPYLVSFMSFALPIAFFMGDLLKSIISPLSEHFPRNALYVYILIAIGIFSIGAYVNYKYPFRRIQKKEFD